MSSTDLKSLKKLADACRKAGITHFKNSEFEFTLSPDAPTSSYKKKQEELKTYSDPNSKAIDDAFNSDTLTDEQLLMWSAIDPTETNIGKVLTYENQ
jgi:hypothetical protein